ncbi:hypothetical protein BDR06DRAFT_640186 [Suillus hirtellus]|nr:hypothetical protein BDR06DRAFT_640186 [Suillus hirtellus]
MAFAPTISVISRTKTMVLFIPLTTLLWIYLLHTDENTVHLKRQKKLSLPRGNAGVPRTDGVSRTDSVSNLKASFEQRTSASGTSPASTACDLN